MKYITKGMYIHRGKGINLWPELGGWMVAMMVTIQHLNV